MDFLKIYQIYFEDSQLAGLDYVPFKNEGCTVFFENSVMRDLILDGKHLDSAYFGVVSYKLRSKLDYTRRWNLPNIANHSVISFTPASFEYELRERKPDVLSFQRHPGHDSVCFADQFHPNFSRFFGEICAKIGFKWVPTVFENVVYCNYFVAKSEIYERYVREMLVPAMDVMLEMPELMGNSHYPHRLPVHLREAFGVEWYPYHAFVLERMFSYFIHLNGLRCLHY